jgi:hypothetical protein
MPTSGTRTWARSRTRHERSGAPEPREEQNLTAIVHASGSGPNIRNLIWKPRWKISKTIPSSPATFSGLRFRWGSMVGRESSEISHRPDCSFGSGRPYCDHRWPTHVHLLKQAVGYQARYTTGYRVSKVQREICPWDPFDCERDPLSWEISCL